MVTRSSPELPLVAARRLETWHLPESKTADYCCWSSCCGSRHQNPSHPSLISLEWGQEVSILILSGPALIGPMFAFVATRAIFHRRFLIFTTTLPPSVSSLATIDTFNFTFQGCGKQCSPMLFWSYILAGLYKLINISSH